MTSFFSQAGVFLIQVVFGFYILTLLLRFLFQVVRADFYNPIAQFVVALTNPLLKPLRRVIPGFFRIDVASVVLLVALEMLELWLVGAVRGLSFTAPVLLLLAIADLVKLALYVLIVGILVRVIISWVNPYGSRYNPAGSLLVSLTEPVLAPARRLIPPVAGVDLSPIVALVVLQLMAMAIDHVLLAVLPFTLTLTP